jgi:hypothetical protein
MSLNRRKSKTEMNTSSTFSTNSFDANSIIDLDIDDEGLFDDDAYDEAYERYQKSCQSLDDARRQMESPKKEDGEEVKMITTLIDDCIEEDEFQEAFTLFIRFVKELDESKKKILFDRYYKILVEQTN